MPKKLKNCFLEKLNFENMINAHYRAKKNKRYKKEVILYELNLENNIINLINNIKNGRYHLGKYRSFIVKDPKTREIKSLPYVDRIVQQWYVEEFIKPYMMPRFIKNTCACIEGRGTLYAINKMQQNMQIYKRNFGDFWILKCDIKKFFYNINLDILYKIMEKHISDKQLLKFTKLLIYEECNQNKVGIPIRKLYFSVLCKYLFK